MRTFLFPIFHLYPRVESALRYRKHTTRQWNSPIYSFPPRAFVIAFNNEASRFVGRQSMFKWEKKGSEVTSKAVIIISRARIPLVTLEYNF